MQNPLFLSSFDYLLFAGAGSVEQDVCNSEQAECNGNNVERNTD